MLTLRISRYSQLMMSFIENTRNAALFIAAVALALYAYSFAVPFYFDDLPHITNSRFLENQDWDGFFSLYWRRIIPYSTIWFEYKLWGENPVGYHLLNIIVHAASAVVLYFLSLRLVATTTDNQKKIALLGFLIAFIWAIHPLNSQPVVYVIQRIALIATFFMLLSIFFWVKARQSAPEKQWIYFTASFVALGLGLLSKEFVLTTPLVWFALDSIVFRRNAKQLASLYLLKGGIAVLVTLFVAWQLFPATLQNLDSLTRETRFYTRWEYFLTQQQIIAHYLYKLILPYPLRLEYPFMSVLTFTQALPWLLLHAAIVGAAFFLGRFSRLIPFGVVMYYLVQLVESGFIPIIDLAFEHRVYHANAGMLIALLSGLWVIYENLKARKTTESAKTDFTNKARRYSVIVIAVLVLMTLFRIDTWVNPESFYRAEARTAGDNPRAYSALGHHLFSEGRYQEAEHYLSVSFEKTVQTGVGRMSTIDNYFRVLLQNEEYARLDSLAREYIPQVGHPRSQGELIATYATMHILREDCNSALYMLNQAMQLAPRDNRIPMFIEYCEQPEAERDIEQLDSQLKQLNEPEPDQL